MSGRLSYGTTAKVFHWLIVVLLMVQYPVGWLMPDIHPGTRPGDAMMFHVSFGIIILALIVMRFFWRTTHPVAPESSLPAWQRLTSEAVHWLLYALVLATTLSGWLLASQRGWSISFFFLVSLPMLTSQNSPIAGSIGEWHAAIEWALLVAIGVHVAAAMAHMYIYRDEIVQRMLPQSEAKLRSRR